MYTSNKQDMYTSNKQDNLRRLLMLEFYISQTRVLLETPLAIEKT
jgi:hypothetical protein